MRSLWVFFLFCPMMAMDSSSWPELLHPDIPAAERLEILGQIYRAEVHGHREECVAALKSMWHRHPSPAWRQSVTRAQAVIKHGQPRVVLSNQDPAEVIQRVRAIWLTKNGQALLLDEAWIEPGDWLGEMYLLDLDFDRAVLEDRFQHATIFPFEPGREKSFDPPGLFALGADPSRVLTFVTRQGGYNSFVPSAFGSTLGGFFPADDWWSCLHLICAELDIVWIRHGDNIVFRVNRDDVLGENQRNLTMNRHDMELAEFLLMVADRFDMELVLLDDLDGLLLDVQLVDQTWSETLDCLAMMNQLHWFLVPREGEKTRLVIEKQ